MSFFLLFLFVVYNKVFNVAKGVFFGGIVSFTRPSYFFRCPIWLVMWPLSLVPVVSSICSFVLNDIES